MGDCYKSLIYYILELIREIVGSVLKLYHKDPNISRL